MNKFVNENIDDLFKPKSQDEMINSLENYDANEILNIAVKNKDKQLAELAFEKGAMIKTNEQFNVLKDFFPENVLKNHMSKAKQLKFGFEVKNAKPNELFAAGVKRKDTQMIKSAMRKGATNINFLNGEAMMIAIEKDDLQLAKMLLKHHKYNPKKGGRTEIMYPHYEQAPLIRSVQNNRPEIVKILLKDPRVDPTTNDFKALKTAIKYKYWDVLEILVKNDKILDNLDPYTTRFILKKLTKLAQNDS